MTTGRKITGLPLPETPKEAPLEVHALVDEIEEALASQGSIQAAYLLGCTFDYLTRYFAGVASAIALHLQVSGESLAVPLEFEQARVQLRERLNALGEQATDPLSRMVRGVFFVGATRSVPTPRRHARLLDLGGIPIRGYRSIGEWIAIEPGTEELASDTKANRELLRYLPILKEWVTATATYFLDSKQVELSIDPAGLLRFTLVVEGQDIEVGPIALPLKLVDLFARLRQEEETDEAASAEVEEAQVTEGIETSAQEEILPAAFVSEAAVDPAHLKDETVEVEVAGVVTLPEVTSEASEVKVPEPVSGVSKDDTAGVAESAEAAESAVPAVPTGELLTLTPELDFTQPSSQEANFEQAGEDLGGSKPEEAQGQDLAEAALADELAVDTDLDDSKELVEDHPDLVDKANLEEEASDPSLDNPFAEPQLRPIEQTVALSIEDLKREGLSFDVSAAVAEELPPVVEELPSAAQAREAAVSEQAIEDSLEGALEDSPQAPSEPTLEPSSPAKLEVQDLKKLEGSDTKPAGSVEKVEKAKRTPPILPFQRGKEEKKSAPPPAPLVGVELYPVVTGPPPEFFDEILVDADCPEVLQAALNDLNGAIESNDSIIICAQMQRCYDLMIQFFAGIAAAVLERIDYDGLSSFDTESSRLSLEDKLELLVYSLATLEEHWESNDAAILLWSVFYDTALPATDPNWTYLHTRLLGVEGAIPKGFLELSELCSKLPGKKELGERSACRELVHHYLPILSFWLETASPLFLDGEIDFVDEDDGLAFSWAASLGGQTLDGTSSGLWLEVSSSRWNLPRPELAPIYAVGDAPDVLLPVIDELNLSLERKDFHRAGLYTRVSLDFLIQYFAGCAAAVWREQSSLSDEGEALYHSSATLGEKERLLGMALEHLSIETDLGASLLKVFIKNSLQYRVFLQRQLQPNQVSISSWVEERGETTEDELLRYLPLLRAWLGTANPWFSAGEQLFEEPTPDGRLEGVIVFGEDYLEMVEPEYVVVLAPECLQLVRASLLESSEVEEVDSSQPLELADEKPAKAVVQERDEALELEVATWPVLEAGPPTLLTYLKRLSESQGEAETVNAWAGGAFEYLIQYFAGLVATVLGDSEPGLGAAALSYFQPKASLRERELLLAEGINVLKCCADGDTQEKIRDVFWDEDGEMLLHSRLLGAGGPSSLNEEDMLLSFFCRARHKKQAMEGKDLRFALAALSSWCSAASSFFALCEHYAEPPEADGQEEIVIEVAEDYLDLALPDYAIQVPSRDYYSILYRESEATAADEAAVFFPEEARPDLLGARAQVLGGIADGADDFLMGAATVELEGSDLFAGSDGFDSSELFRVGEPVKPDKLKETPKIDSPYARKKRTGTVKLGSTAEAEGSEADDKRRAEVTLTEEALAEAESEAAGRRRKKKRTKKNELSNAMLELYKKERLEKARKRAEARARKEEVVPTKLDYKLSYRGLKNSKQLGGRCHFGLIELRNSGGGQLKGTIEPNHPCIKVTPSRFEANELRVSYQIDPSDMPSTGRVGLSLITQDERVDIQFARLVPTSWWSDRKSYEAVGLMALPAACFMIFFSWLLTFGPGANLIASFDSLITGELALKSKLFLWLFSVLIILLGAVGVPALVKSLFSRWSYGVQEETRRFLPPLMSLPFLVVAFILYGTSLWVTNAPPSGLPTLASRLVFALIVFLENMLAAAFFYLQAGVWWEEHHDTILAKRLHIGFWALSGLLSLIATFFLAMF